MATYTITLTAGTGIAGYSYTYYDSTNTYRSSSTTATTKIITAYSGTLIRVTSVSFSSGYTYPVTCGSWTMYNSSGTAVDPTISVNANRSLTISATAQASTTKGSVTIDMGTGITGYSFYYYLDGTRYSRSTTSSRLTIASDVGTDIQIYGFTYSSNYGEDVEFAEYTSTAHTTLVKSWYYPADPYITVKSSTRYFVFTATPVEYTYYGRITLDANGGRFTTNSSTYIYWPTSGNMSNTGMGGATVSTTLPTSSSSYIPTYSGYTFVGWATDADATTPNYYSGGSVSFTAKSTSSSSPTRVTLYAVWKEIYTLSYSTSLSDVTNMPSSSSISGVGYILCSSTIPVKSGYTFQGWAETDGGSVRYVGGNSIYISADKVLYAVFEKITLSLFYWTGDSDADSTTIAKGQPVSNLTATMWNNYLAKVEELATACGVTFTYTAVTSGSGITASRFNIARTGLVNIKSELGGSTTLPSTVSQGQTILASYFIGAGSLRNALNGLINIYNSQ